MLELRLIPIDPMPQKVLAKLTRLARQWGGNILSVTPEVFETYKSREDFDEAPFTIGALGVVYSEKLIVFVPGAQDVNWPALTHEMGHCFASMVKPEQADESSFIGWEFRLARLVGTQSEWLPLNSAYVLTEDGYNISHLLEKNPKRLRSELKKSVQHSKELGLLDSNLNPIAIR